MQGKEKGQKEIKKQEQRERLAPETKDDVT